MEDIRIGRKKISRVSAVTVANGVSTPLAQHSNNRTHIAFAVTTTQAGITPIDGDPTTNAAFHVAANIPHLSFDIEEYGDLVTKAWEGAGVGAASLVLVTETFLEER
jgi:hypothetical protein